MTRALLVAVVATCAACGPADGTINGFCKPVGVCDSGLVCDSTDRCVAVSPDTKGCCECMTSTKDATGGQCFPISIETCEQDAETDPNALTARCSCWNECASFCGPVPDGC